MRYHSRFLVCLALLGLALVPGLAKSDITPLDFHASPAGGSASPKSPHKTIRLESQEVVVRLRSYSYTVDAVFHLFNKGDTTSEQVGFPKQVSGRPPGPLGDVGEFKRFVVSANGKQIPLRFERDSKSREVVSPAKRAPNPEAYAGWLMGEAVFPGQAGTTIRVSYESPYGSCGWECSQAEYIFGTGRYWDGPIGRALFIVDTAEKSGTGEFRPGFSGLGARGDSMSRRVVSKDLVVYEIKDFEPSPEGRLHITLLTGSRHTDDNSALLSASMNGRLEEVRALLEKGADVNSARHGWTPLMMAARHGSVEVVNLLLDKGADPNAVSKSGMTALKFALSDADGVGEQVEASRVLKARGAKPTDLATAAFVGDMDAVKRFLESGADLKGTGKRNDSIPLIAAAMGGQCEVIQLLLKKGANIDIRDNREDTPLIKAAATGQLDAIRLLLAKGANVNARNAHRRTPLEKAAWWGHAEAIRALVDGGADVEARDDTANRTPLMHAAQMGRLDAVKALVEKGANVKATDSGGETALDLARRKNVSEIREFLKARGAR